MAEFKTIHMLVVGVRWPPETFLARLFRGLLERGVALTVACETHPGSEWVGYAHFQPLLVPAWQGPVLLRLIHLARLSLQGATRAHRDTSAFLQYAIQEDDTSHQLRKFFDLLPFAGHRWDVVYFPWNSAAIHYLPLFEMAECVVLSCRGSQVNVTPHNPKQVQLREGLGTTFERANVVHCVSEDIKREAMRYDLDPAKAVVIRPAVDPGFFQPGGANGKERDHFRVTSTGSLIWRKGYEYALVAIRNLLDQGIPVRYDIIGAGKERQRLLYTIHDLNLVEHVRLLGTHPPTEVRDLLQHSDAFLLPSLSEGISNAVLEAMACGLPVVTTDCGGMREAVTDGVEGFVVPVRDPDAMARALMRLASDPALRERLGKAGRERVLEEFALDQQVTCFASMLERLVEA